MSDVTLTSVFTLCLERLSQGDEQYLVISPNNDGQKDPPPGQHKHTYFEFCVLVQGQSRILYYDKNIDLESGMTLFITPETYHLETPKGPNNHYRLLWGILDTVTMRLHISEYHGEEEYRIVDGIDLPNTVQSLISELVIIMRKRNDNIRNYFFQSMVMIVLSYAINALQHQSGENKWRENIIEEIEEFISANLSKHISLEDISSRIGLSPCYISTLYKKYRGDTLFHYLNKKRIQNACGLLVDPKLNISEISYNVGFDDPYYFSKVFKKIQGCTPREYRDSIA